MARRSQAKDLFRLAAQLSLLCVLAGAATSGRAQTQNLQEFAVSQFSAGAIYTPGPNRIIKGPDGNVWVTFTYVNGNTVQGYIGQISPAGTVLSAVTTQGSPSALTSGPSGDYFSIWFIENVNGVWEVGRVSAVAGTAPAVTLEVPIPYQQYASNSLAPTPNAITNAAATNVDNGIYLTDTSNAIIWRVNPTAVNPGPANLAWTVINIDAPAYGIALGPDNNLWFTEYRFTNGEGSNIANIAYITPPTSATTTFPLPSPFNTPSTFDAITSGPDLSSVWFSQNQGTAIDSISTSASAGSSPTLRYSPSGSTVNDMTLGPDFAIWFTQTFAATASIRTGPRPPCAD